MSDIKTLRGQHPDWFIERDGKPYVLYQGLLALAHDKGLKGITVTVVQLPTELNGMTAVCSATALMPDGEFTEVGDASPSNVTRMLTPHIIRMAATRGKARALRDAVNVGITAFEELGDDGPAPTRAPGVVSRGQTRIEEDLGRGTAAPRPVSAAAANGPYAPGGPAGRPLEATEWPGSNRAPLPSEGNEATPKQLGMLIGLARRLPDRPEVPEGLTRRAASDLITEWAALVGPREEGPGR